MLDKFAAAALLALALGGCAVLHPEEKLQLPPAPGAQAGPQVSPEAQARGVELTKQQGGRFIAFVGPRLQHSEKFLGVSDTNYFALRSWLDNKTGEVAHQLYVEDSYDGSPYLWDGVHDLDNKTLKFIPISRNQITCDQGCSYADEFAAELPEDYLRAHRTGLAVTFVTSDGKKLAVTVPPELVVAELNAVDSVRAVAAKAAANTPPPSTPTTATPPASAAPATGR